MNTIGTRLEDERDRRGLTQKQFAELLGMGQASYNDYKSGKKGMSADVLMRVAGTLGWAPEYLYYGQGVQMSKARTHHEAQLLELLRKLPSDQHDTVIGMVRVAVDGLIKANSGVA